VRAKVWTTARATVIYAALLARVLSLNQVNSIVFSPDKTAARRALCHRDAGESSPLLIRLL
jgi:hypothetical protein